MKNVHTVTPVKVDESILMYDMPVGSYGCIVPREKNEGDLEYAGEKVLCAYAGEHTRIVVCLGEPSFTWTFVDGEAFYNHLRVKLYGKGDRLMIDIEDVGNEEAGA